MIEDGVRTLEAFVALGDDLYVREGTLYLVTATLAATEVTDVEGRVVVRVHGTLGKEETPFEFDLPPYAPSENVVGLAILQRLDELLGGPFTSPRFTKWLWPARCVLRGDFRHAADRALLADWLAVLPNPERDGGGVSTFELLESIGFQPRAGSSDDYEYAPLAGGATYSAQSAQSGLIYLTWSLAGRTRSVRLPRRLESIAELYERANGAMPLPVPRAKYVEATLKLHELPFWREHSAKAAAPDDTRCQVRQRDLLRLLSDLRRHLEDPEPHSNAVFGFDGVDFSLRVKGKRYLLPAVGTAWAERYRVPALAFCWTKDIVKGLPAPCVISVEDDLLILGPWAVKGVSVYNRQTQGER